MKQHFEIGFDPEDYPAFFVKPTTDNGFELLTETVWIYSEMDEITQGCINRIVDNLNKLAEYNGRTKNERPAAN